MASQKTKKHSRHNIIEIGPERVDHIASANAPDDLLQELQDTSLEGLRKHLKVQFRQNFSQDCVFSLIHIDASVANAFRRILLSELSHLAIEDVFIFNNTSIIQDEVLAQRLGLVPLKGNPTSLRWLETRSKLGDDPNNPGEQDGKFDYNCVRLSLKVKCEWQKGWKDKVRRGETDPDELYVHHNVYANDIKFTPIGAQEEMFSTDRGAIAPVHPKILLAKLRPGQEINLEMDAVLGTGADHAKFSPVATASYRLMPTIDIVKPIVGDDAIKFQACFPAGVIKTVSVTAQEAKRKGSGYEGHEGKPKAVVYDTFGDTVSRECLRYDEFKGKVKLGRQRDHFIFSIESVGQQRSDELFLDAVHHLREKCLHMKRCVQDLKDRM